MSESQSVAMRPGAGWNHLSGPVWEHNSGARIHCGGLVRLPNGNHYHLNHCAQTEGIRKAIAMNGLNVKRGLMAWAACQVGALPLDLGGMKCTME